jgi:ArsR family transcriptional regulator, arsenate/arsenite/antimonite-responsive transcriptional repressor
MKKHQALAALAALAQDNRLDIFRLLVEAGPDGLSAGKISEQLGLAPNTLTFHSTGCAMPALSLCAAKAAR